MERIALILSVVTGVVALLGGFKWLVNEWRLWRIKGRRLTPWMVLVLCLLPMGAEAACSGSSPNWTCDFNSVAALSYTRNDTITLTDTGTVAITNVPTFTKEVTLVGPGSGSLNLTRSSIGINVNPDSTVFANDGMMKFSGFTLNGNGSALNLMAVVGSPYNATSAFNKFVLDDIIFTNTGTVTSGSGALLMDKGVYGVGSNIVFDRVNVAIKFMGNDTFNSAGCDFPADVTNALYYPISMGMQGNGKAFYLEDYTIKYTTSHGASDPGWTETGHGSVGLVKRYGKHDLANATGQEITDVHGQQGYGPTPCTGDGGQVSGTIKTEEYGLIMTNMSTYLYLNHRGGWGIYFNNVISGSGGSGITATQYDGGCQSIVYTSPVGKPFMEISNVYLWNITVNGSREDMVKRDPADCGPTAPCNNDCPPEQDVAFWNQASNTLNASPCTTASCTSGIGRGPNIPTGSCADGTAYYVASNAAVLTGTDASGFLSAANKAIIQASSLYTCQSGAWGLYWQPYTYPHPLRGLASPEVNIGLRSIMGMRTMQWLEIVLPVLGLGWHFKRQIFAISIAMIGFMSTTSYMTWQLGKGASKETAVKVLTIFNERTK